MTHGLHEIFISIRDPNRALATYMKVRRESHLLQLPQTWLVVETAVR
jgi:hypothetical protein